jgi:hypothetical protein
VTRYLLDANVFIQAKNLHYGFDFCPAFWEWLVVQNTAGKVASIEKVADELTSGEDELTSWARDRGSAFFLPADDAILPALGTVSIWASGLRAMSQRLSPHFCKWRIIGSSLMSRRMNIQLLLMRFRQTQ